MIIGVPKETMAGENRVALVPGDIPTISKLGAEVWLESGAGIVAGYPDPAYQERGGQIAPDRKTLFQKADILVQVRAAGANPEGMAQDMKLMRSGQYLIAFLEPLWSPQHSQELAAKGVNAFSMELVPRITRAQGMDALSSMANIAGYKAVLIAAETLPRMFPMMMTAAGTLSPAHVFVIGAGVAGLQAIATAKRLGAKVEAYDVRPVVKDQVESVGGKFVELPLETGGAEGSGGYAKAQDESFYRRQRELMAEVVARNDVVITTAAIPGRKSPLLITADAVKGMRPRSVIIDLAAERGGNCELTRSNETIEVHGVTIIGPANLPASVPFHASQMYSRNITTFLRSLIKDGAINLNMEDEVIRDTLVTNDGKVINERVRSLLEPASSAQVSA
ncbi:MAG: Re/Si-specific NAD(P)(+) transhydrogenase subunit alpha [Chloroflexaceae bacterium]|nr:Re/Si-specific NAD(P)(+) transhydrogenase subunit alpha [Chloroflexaceae bacterium]